MVRDRMWLPWVLEVAGSYMVELVELALALAEHVEDSRASAIAERTAEVHVLALVGTRPFASGDAEAAARAAIAPRLAGSALSLGRVLRHWKRRWTTLRVEAALERVAKLVEPLPPAARAELLRDAEALLQATATPSCASLHDHDLRVGLRRALAP